MKGIRVFKRSLLIFITTGAKYMIYILFFEIQMYVNLNNQTKLALTLTTTELSLHHK